MLLFLPPVPRRELCIERVAPSSEVGAVGRSAPSSAAGANGDGPKFAHFLFPLHTVLPSITFCFQIHQERVLSRHSWEQTGEGETLVNSLLEILSFPSLLNVAPLLAAFCASFNAVGLICAMLLPTVHPSLQCLAPSFSFLLAGQRCGCGGPRLAGRRGAPLGPAPQARGDIPTS